MDSQLTEKRESAKFDAVGDVRKITPRDNVLLVRHSQLSKKESNGIAGSSGRVVSKLEHENEKKLIPSERRSENISIISGVDEEKARLSPLSAMDALRTTLR